MVYIKPDDLKHHERVRKQSSVYFARRRTENGMDVIHAADVWFQKLPLLKAVVLDSAPRTDDGPRADENDWERIVYSILKNLGRNHGGGAGGFADRAQHQRVRHH